MLEELFYPHFLQKGLFTLTSAKFCQILRRKKEQFTLIDILKYMGFSSDVLLQETDISTENLRNLHLILETEDFSIDFFELIEQRKMEEEDSIKGEEGRKNKESELLNKKIEEKANFIIELLKKSSICKSS